MKRKKVVISSLLLILLLSIAFGIFVIKQSDEYSHKCILNSWIVGYDGPFCHGKEISVFRDNEFGGYHQKYCIGYWSCNK